MKRTLLVLVCAIVLTSSSSAWADDPAVTTVLQDIPAGPDRIVPIRKGDSAPFEGQLYDNATALRWGNWLMQYKFRLDADVQLQKKLGEADTELWRKKYELMDEKYKLVATDYQGQVAHWETEAARYKSEAENPPWYRTPLMGFAMGVVFTSVAVGAGAYAIHALK
jgi:hypothetical protein